MNTESVDCTRRPCPFPGPTKPGDFCWEPDDGSDTRFIYVHVPGDTAPSALSCFKGADRGIEREWGWDGNEEKPTLTPSILNQGVWHGHMVAGRLVSC